MCRAISEAYEVDEVKDIRDKAIAWEVYSRQAGNFEAERRACEIRLRAERKAGELSKKIDKSPGGRPAKTLPTMGRVSTKQETLAAAGVSVRQAERWEKLADVPEEQFEAALAGPDMPTTSGIIEAVNAPPVTPVSTGALRLWSALCGFERENWLAQDPEEIMATMVPTMRADVLRLAPLVSDGEARGREAD
jgi:hypothetical protein